MWTIVTTTIPKKNTKSNNETKNELINMRWKKKRNKRTHCSFSNRIVDSRKKKIERIHSKLHWNEMFASFPCLPMNANERQVKWYVWIVQIMTLKSLKRICIVHDNYYDLYIEVMKVLLCFFSYSLSRISKFQRNKSFEFTQKKERTNV